MQAKNQRAWIRRHEMVAIETNACAHPTDASPLLQELVH